MLKLISQERGFVHLEEPNPEEALEDHQHLIESYFQSYRVRNYSWRTIQKERRFLEKWFWEQTPERRNDTGRYPLFVWDAMEPLLGRGRVQHYSQHLIDQGIATDTVRAYLGLLRRFFSYILEHPFLTNHTPARRIEKTYGPIEQPITQVDLPHHTYDGERLGVPLDPERLYAFYRILKKHYLKPSFPKKDSPSLQEAVRARNYALAVLAGESGLRIDELIHLEGEDLFFDSFKVQTRHAKGSKGSGKRARQTLFPPLARDTLRFYLKRYRPLFAGAETSALVFLSQRGEPLSHAMLHASLQEMIRLAQQQNFPVLDHMSWHWFRRIFATRFIERFPGRLYVLIDLLGHQSPNTVHRYIRHSQAWMDEQVQSVLQGAGQWPSNGD